MTAMRYHASQPDNWITPRPHSDANRRYLVHGPIRPMREPSFLERLFGRR